MLTVCMFCGKVLHDPGRWQLPNMEEKKRMKKEPLSHGLCPVCMYCHYGLMPED